MSLANFDYLLDPPDPCTDFYCMLCGTMKPLDDLAPKPEPSMTMPCVPGVGRRSMSPPSVSMSF